MIFLIREYTFEGSDGVEQPKKSHADHLSSLYYTAEGCEVEAFLRFRVKFNTLYQQTDFFDTFVTRSQTF